MSRDQFELGVALRILELDEDIRKEIAEDFWEQNSDDMTYQISFGKDFVTLIHVQENGYEVISPKFLESDQFQKLYRRLRDLVTEYNIPLYYSGLDSHNKKFTNYYWNGGDSPVNFMTWEEL